MSRPIDQGLSERRAWIQLEQFPVYGTPFSLGEIVSYVLLGFLTVCVLMLW